MAAVAALVVLVRVLALLVMLVQVLVLALVALMTWQWGNNNSSSCRQTRVGWLTLQLCWYKYNSSKRSFKPCRQAIHCPSHSQQQVPSQGLL